MFPSPRICPQHFIGSQSRGACSRPPLLPEQPERPVPVSHHGSAYTGRGTSTLCRGSQTPPEGHGPCPGATLPHSPHPSTQHGTFCAESFVPVRSSPCPAAPFRQLFTRPAPWSSHLSSHAISLRGRLCHATPILSHTSAALSTTGIQWGFVCAFVHLSSPRLCVCSLGPRNLARLVFFYICGTQTVPGR